MSKPIAPVISFIAASVLCLGCSGSDAPGVGRVGAAVRGCELRLSTDDPEVVVSFSREVVGHSVRRGRRLGVAFRANEDTPISAPIEVRGAVELQDVRCVDAEGHVISEPGFELGR